MQIYMTFLSVSALFVPLHRVSLMQRPYYYGKNL